MRTRIRHAVEADAIVAVAGHHGCGNLVHAVLGGLLLVEREVEDLERQFLGRRGVLLEQRVRLPAGVSLEDLSEVHQTDRVLHRPEESDHFGAVGVVELWHGPMIAPWRN